MSIGKDEKIFARTEPAPSVLPHHLYPVLFVAQPPKIALRVEFAPFTVPIFTDGGSSFVDIRITEERD